MERKHVQERQTPSRYQQNGINLTQFRGWDTPNDSIYTRLYKENGCTVFVCIFVLCICILIL